jgi:ribosome-binding factor A
MLSRRLARLNEQVREDLAELITRELKDPRIAGLVSVTAVELSPDLRHARIFISVYGTEEQRRQTFAALHSATGFLRSQLAARMTTRRAPELHFVPDISIERGQRILRLLHEIEHTMPPDQQADEGETDAGRTGQS